LRRAASALAAAALVLALAAAPEPARGQGPVPPRPALDARSALLIDARTGETLYELDARARRPIASATKLMTALVTLERADPSDLFVAPAYRAGPLESRINLRTGERLLVRDLLTALLLESANDAAVTLAVGVSGSRPAFVAEMNRRARELGLRDTRFANPIGLDDPDNFSSARDLASMAQRLLRNKRFARIVDRPQAELRSGDRSRVVRNRNRLVARVPLVDGVKTGHTRAAGYVLVGSAQGDGARVISVVLGEPSEAARDADSLELLRFGLAQFRRVRALARGRVLARVAVEHRDEKAPLAASRDLSVTVRRGSRPRVRVSAPDELEGPLPAGRRVGSVRVEVNGRRVRTAALVTTRPVAEGTLARRLTAGVGGPLTFLLFLVIVIAAMLVLIRVRGSIERGRRAR